MILTLKLTSWGYPIHDIYRPSLSLHLFEVSRLFVAMSEGKKTWVSKRTVFINVFFWKTVLHNFTQLKFKSIQHIQLHWLHHYADQINVGVIFFSNLERPCVYKSNRECQVTFQLHMKWKCFHHCYCASSLPRLFGLASMVFWHILFYKLSLSLNRTFLQSVIPKTNW